MTVTSTITRKDYTLDGVVLIYPYDFKIFSATDLEVKKLSVGGIETTLTLTTDYSVTGAGTENGGNVVLVSAGTSGETLVIRRNIPLTQPTSFRNQRDFFAERHEDAYDRATMQIQQQTEEANRAVLLPVTFTGETAIVNLIPGYALGVNSTGTGVECVPNTGANQTADLANTALATRGAGLVGYAYALAYGAGTVGKELKDIKDAATADTANLAAANAKVTTLQTVPGRYRNYRASCTGASAVITMTADLATVRSAGGLSVGLTAVSLSLNTATVGANGLNTGTLAINTWYHKYVIFNPNTGTVAALCSLSATAPTLPSGYTHWMRMGAFQTDGTTANKFPLAMTWKDNRAQYKTGVGNVPPGGLAIATGASARTSVAWSSVFPPTAIIGHMLLFTSSAAAYVWANATAHTDHFLAGTNNTANNWAWNVSCVLEGSTVDYQGGTYSTLRPVGWEDSL